MLLILAILGPMYAGIATPSESAAVGVLGALLIAYFQKGLTRQSMRDIAMGSIQTCAMIALILLGASILSHATAFLGITQAISGGVTALNLSPIGLITFIIGL